MKKTIFLFITVFLATFCSAYAHRVNLFCYTEDNVLHGEGYFVNGDAVKHSTVEVYSNDDNILIGSTTTDEEGKFELPLSGADTIKVILIASMGHRTEYIVTQETVAQEQSAIEPAADSEQAPLDYQEIGKLIQKEIQPLREDLRRIEKVAGTPSLAEIIGGLGWIVGMFSLLYLLRKKNAS